jgi:hypothetical protein
MEEQNRETEPIVSDKEATPSKDTASSEVPYQLILPIFLLAAIEFDFVLNLIHLIRTHAPLWYVSTAVVIQLGLGIAAITYRRIWRMLRSTGSPAVDTDRLLAKIGYMVMCLLFALMFYSHYAALAARAPQ